MTVAFDVDDDEISALLALVVPPGTVVAERDKLLDEHLTEPLFDIARSLGVVLAAAPHDYARPQDGHDPNGQTRFVVRGRIEGDRLVPIGRGKRRARG